MITSEKATELLAENRLSFGRYKKLGVGAMASGNMTEDIVADRMYPPFNRVMMDGIAVSFSVIENRRNSLKVLGVVAAGQKSPSLPAGDVCLEVMTGAVLPEGADLVIPYEDIKLKDGCAELSHFDYPKGSSVHKAGTDLVKGAALKTEGAKLNGPLWGILTSFGYPEVSVESPRILLVATGNELVDHRETPEQHQIRMSNVYALKGSLLSHGYHDVDIIHLLDDKDDISAHFSKASCGYDILIYSGGVSKGKFDYLPEVWEEQGVEKIFHRIAQRPGKPLWYGVHKESATEVFGLPGNPISSLVCLHRYVLNSKPIKVQLSTTVHFDRKLNYFLPASLSQSERAVVLASPVSMKNSGQFAVLAESDGFLDLPAEQDEFEAGTVYDFYKWRPS